MSDIASRSNYVRVKDHAGLSKALYPFKHLSLHSGKNGMYCILAEYDSSFYQYSYTEDETGETNFDEEVEFDPRIHVIPYLKDNEVFIVQEVGHDKLRSLFGFAEAFQGDKKLSINLDNIYGYIEKEWGTDEYTTADH